MISFPILQFGASRFLQAHVDLFVSDALTPRRSDGAHRRGGDQGSPESRREGGRQIIWRPLVVNAD